MEILNSLPSTDTVIDMIDTSKEEVVSAVDEVTGALKLNLEGVRRDVVRKTAREDVLRLIAKALAGGHGSVEAPRRRADDRAGAGAVHRVQHGHGFCP